MNKKRGISIVEVIISVSIILAVGIVFASGLSRSLDLSQKALRTSQASWIMEDSVEAIRTIRDTDWSTISALSPATDYYLTFNTGTNTWSITSSNPGTIDNVFNRKFVISAVNRDANDDIAVSGTNDANTRYVKVTVSWNVSGVTISKDVDFYISNIF